MIIWIKLIDNNGFSGFYGGFNENYFNTHLIFEVVDNLLEDGAVNKIVNLVGNDDRLPDSVCKYMESLGWKYSRKHHHYDDPVYSEAFIKE